ncbi:MAG: hypothetical protein KHX03_08285 [Clostridium sp.]|nr:hypothetical protein [Clostridium sp.]
MNNKDLLTEFFAKKNYSYLKEVLKNSSSNYEKGFLARIYLEEKNYQKAAELYEQAGMLFEYGRCQLLQGEFNKTKDIWGSIKEENPAVLWGKSLLEFINLYVINIPTFFQIRAFLEVDLDALLNANLITYCENIVNGAHLLAQNNQESYKFIGRVFVNNGYFDLADLFLQKAKDVCYVDPEVHFLLAKCYIHNKDIQSARKALETSLEKGFGYYPAKKLLDEINLS